MPSARELLEQADALMRRNRAAGQADGEPRKGGDTVTLGASSIAPHLVSPRTIALEPIAPAVARTSLPDDASEAPLPPSSAARGDSDDDVPLLTDAIVDASPANEVAEIDDVPLLTDAVEEIEVTVVSVDAADESERGESSVWPQSRDDDTSVLGRAPDLIASVPDPAEVPQSPPLGRDPLGLDQPAAGFVAPQSARSDEAIVDASRASPIIDTSVDETIVEIPAATTTETDTIVEHDAASDEPHVADVAIPAPVVVRSEADEARIREIAEEIGMQVLQRIDIFADTSLREKVGERLKPVVERVSAELVDALNQHVGELLRAYVAEAIEREIETWRKRE